MTISLKLDFEVVEHAIRTEPAKYDFGPDNTDMVKVQIAYVGIASVFIEPIHRNYYQMNCNLCHQTMWTDRVVEKMFYVDFGNRSAGMPTTIAKCSECAKTFRFPGTLKQLIDQKVIRPES